jgi:hypothetical protein
VFRIISIIIFILFLSCGAILILGFFSEAEFNNYKPILGGVIVLGWALTIVSFFSYLIASIQWMISKKNWYWESFYPLNFSLVLWVTALLGYNKEMGFVGGVTILFLSFPSALLVSHFKLHKTRFYFLVVSVCFIPNVSYLVALFVGCLLFILSIMELTRKSK